MKFSPDAAAAIQRLFDGPDDKLAARVDDLLDIVEADPGDARVRRGRAHGQSLWIVRAGDFTFMWDMTDGEPFIRWAGNDF